MKILRGASKMFRLLKGGSEKMEVGSENLYTNRRSGGEPRKRNR